MISFEDFKKLDLKVAKIVDVKEHSNADRLYVVQVDVGDETTKQVVAGIRGSYSTEDLVGKKVIIVNNLEAVTLRGEESQGMILAASGDDGPIVLTPERDVPIGAKVS